MNTYLVVREIKRGKWVYTVKVVVPQGPAEPLGSYPSAKQAHADADSMAALTPVTMH